MTLDEFAASLAHPAPPAELPPALAAVWWMMKGDWERAHHLVDKLEGRDEAWVHAHLHRVEGDLANAGYWYRRAGRPPSEATLEIEREEIAKALLSSGH